MRYFLHSFLVLYAFMAFVHLDILWIVGMSDIGRAGFVVLVVVIAGFRAFSDIDF